MLTYAGGELVLVLVLVLDLNLPSASLVSGIELRSKMSEIESVFDEDFTNVRADKT